MKLVMQVKLLSTPEQAAALHTTLHTCNSLANRISGQAYEKKVFSRMGLQKLVYAELKAAGLSAQRRSGPFAAGCRGSRSPAGRPT